MPVTIHLSRLFKARYFMCVFAALHSGPVLSAAIGTGSVNWVFDTAPTTVNLNLYTSVYNDGYTQSYSQPDAPLADSFSGAFWDSRFSGSYDLNTLNFDYAVHASASQQGTVTNVLVDYLVTINVTTDVLRFSYDYDYSAMASGVDTDYFTDYFSSAVQLEVVSNDNERTVWYSDYDYQQAGFQSQFRQFNSAWSNDIIDATGSVYYEFGTPGIERQWTLRADVIGYGSTVTPAPVPLPAPILMLLSGIAGLMAVAHKAPRKTSTVQCLG